jgi:hypothetical protein
MPVCIDETTKGFICVKAFAVPIDLIKSEIHPDPVPSSVLGAIASPLKPAGEITPPLKTV